MKLLTISVAGILLIVALIVVVRPGLLCEAVGLGCEEGRARACLQATGSKTELGSGISCSGICFCAHLGANERIAGSADPEVLKLVLECMREARREASWPADDYFVEESVQIGRVARDWATGEYKLNLIAPVDQARRDGLFNLAFGPAGGFRQELIEDWCTVNAGCVSCTHSDSIEATTVEVADGATFEKRYAGKAPLASNRREDYQLIEVPPGSNGLPEGVGRRVIFTCAK